ncbi:glycosyltransferase [Pleomorphomonas sp. NRK KF1]|uniref:glycosyltransferase n=1 Tax=Pleomorphomonas sp. NRK KF1 TaxID=2943000 RepID=UPI00204410C0|nr:glycosyltransferase [Pleomorphomonas sp. NRK KF1]MCM5555940.1 glycosyltransferase [Pleomorphomonas sp. NRK KF1]
MSQSIPRRVRIMQFSSLWREYRIGGAEATAEEIAKQYVRMGNAVTVVTSVPRRPCPVRRRDGYRLIELRSRNVYWRFGNAQHSLPFQILWYLVSMLSFYRVVEFLRLIWRVRPDFIQLHVIEEFSPWLLVACRLSGVPTLQVNHDYFSMCVRGSIFRRGQECKNTCAMCKPQYYLRKRMSRKIDCQVFISAAQRRIFLQRGLLTNRRSCVIYNGIMHDPKLLPEGRLFSSLEALRVGYIGRITPEKGLDQFIDAARFFAENRIPATFLIAGNGPADYVATLHQRLPDNAKLIGFQNAIEFLKSVDIFVMPSLWPEPFGRVTAEALYCQSALVASDVGASAELAKFFTHSRLFKMGDARDLYRALLEIRTACAGQMRHYRDPVAVRELLSVERQCKELLAQMRIILTER